MNLVKRMRGMPPRCGNLTLPQPLKQTTNGLMNPPLISSPSISSILTKKPILIPNPRSRLRSSLLYRPLADVALFLTPIQPQAQ